MKISYFPLTNPQWGAFSPAWQAAVQAGAISVGSFSPFWDPAVTWTPAFLYLDSYAIYTDPTRNSATVNQHPEWILKDAAGNPCYIPWGSPPLPQYAGDVGNQAFRDYMIGCMLQAGAGGYEGIWLDDVNLDISRVSNATSNPVTPIDPRTKAPMTPLAWKSYFLQYLQQARKATQAVGLQMLHNTVWYFGTGASDPIIDAEIQAADWIYFQYGFASDGGLTGGSGQWSVAAKIAQMQRVYKLGARPVSGENTLGANCAMGPYALACLRMADPQTGPVGALDVQDQNPAMWGNPPFSNLLAADIGTPTGPAERIMGLWRRQYSAGCIFMVEPGSDAITLDLDAPMTDASTGLQVSAITLAAKQGSILHA